MYNIIILSEVINSHFSLVFDIDSFVAQVRNSTYYFSPSRLALNAKSSPKKSEFMTSLSIYVSLVTYISGGIVRYPACIFYKAVFKL